ncbi:hypothetical protein ACFV2U_15170 [Streptomyces sp. NPDC059697]|uniref:hypothetical protein n=1 Tax=Streptomyces sp. NPDC059697 TaxID=3346912 RepID=UPI0036AF9F3E
MLVESLELPAPDEPSVPDELPVPDEPSVPDELPVPDEPSVPDELPVPDEPVVPGRRRLLAPDERLGPGARVPGDRRSALARVTATR